MPFTFAHPAIVLPFAKWRNVSATGLIAGAMAPDFEYFLRLKVQSSISHTFLGLLVFNLPVAIIVSLMFHQLIKKKLVDNLPLFFRSRLQLLKDTDWWIYFRRNFLVVSVSVLIGAVSHLFWDAFTHKTGYFVGKLAVLQLEVSGIPVYKLVQHTSTLFGFIVIGYVFGKEPRTLNVKSAPSLNFWAFVVLGTIILQSLRFMAGAMLLKIGNLIVSSMGMFFVSLTVVCLLYMVLKKKETVI
ncbi:DUF4184 family protein [Flavobacterium pedocola]